ncbi:unnamed protein product (macronuclear) [Paramecium tetraurelia]|uniref:Uncharacterized protein n=1 Tax=Paramecium tetraurelia TaxID=5888 RepID=A0E317_PARTE|nr:uncharacterized protein GSPATT00022857001 [Paramecium tetraurelia]CAK89684.1 unnamed protein product [Paramecium tetraurelia]|eukprot:XP_001457081.1 hypothetical protein (macronuclear) [Paramecium tetraurelia strain d4-2]
MTNLEQIYHLQWQGVYNEEFKKIGEWRVLWKGAQLTDVGGSYKNGKKFGLWKELFKNYWDKGQVYEIGEYKNNQKIGVWKFKNRENLMYQNYQFQVVVENIMSMVKKLDFGLIQVMPFGILNKQRIRVNIKMAKNLVNGKSLKKQRMKTLNQQVGAHIIHQVRSMVSGRNRILILPSKFNIEQIRGDKVYYNGEYVNGLKIGRWNLNSRVEKGDEEMYQVLIFYFSAGGFYNEQGLKEGVWLELSHEYQKNGKIFHQGYYNNGKKINRWKTIFRNQSIGGGLYDKQELKVGLWAEPSDLFWKFFSFNSCFSKNQVMYHGEYVNGKKIGRWDISFKEEGEDRPEWMFRIPSYHNPYRGGGRYDEQGCKIGKWVDLIDNLNDNNQVTYSGEYKDGTKQGVWDLMDLNSLIGGGSFDEEGLKHGKWIDQSDNFGFIQRFNNQVTFEGSYSHGRRIDKWEWNNRIEKMQNETTIHLGMEDFMIKNVRRMVYGWNCVKILRSNIGNYSFSSFNQVFYEGGYKNGRKQGKWDIKFRYQFENDILLIGGGQYDQESKKNGQWVDLSENFSKDKKIFYNGNYQNSKKYGYWKIEYKNEKIGGGSYDELDLKNGVWIELNDEFNQYFLFLIICRACKILNSGEYINGKKIGRWNTQYKEWGQKNYEQIGGGCYNQQGLKVGKWIVLSENFKQDSKTMYEGEYENGKKKGKWLIKYRGRQSDHYQKIGSGQFDDQGLKNGQWIVLSDHFSEINQLFYLGLYLNGKKVGKWVDQIIEEKSTHKQIQQ